MNESESDYSSPFTGSVEGLGLGKKPKKKNPLMQGLLQMQQSMAEPRPGTLSAMAADQGALGTASAGPMEEVPALKKKKKLGAT